MKQIETWRLFRPPTKNMIRFLIIGLCVNSILFGVLLIAAHDLFLESLILYGVLTFAVSLIFLMFCINNFVNCQFCDDEIKIRWARFVYRKVSYDRIKGIKIVGAVYSKGSSPVLDKNKRQRAIILTFDRYEHLSNGIRSDSTYPLPIPIFSLDLDLCCDFFSADILQILLEKTDAIVYITEKMLNLYKSDLEDLLKANSDRFIVAYYDEFEKNEQKLLYKQYCNRSKEIESGDYLQNKENLLISENKSNIDYKKKLTDILSLNYSEYELINYFNIKKGEFYIETACLVKKGKGIDFLGIFTRDDGKTLDIIKFADNIEFNKYYCVKSSVSNNYLGFKIIDFAGIEPWDYQTYNVSVFEIDNKRFWFYIDYIEKDPFKF